MRKIKVHTEKSIRFTNHAEKWCHALNQYKRANPDATFKQMSEAFGLSETNTRRYYYGVHHANLGYFKCGYSQIRLGACVSI